jgi:hypothetical protein
MLMGSGWRGFMQGCRGFFRGCVFDRFEGNWESGWLWLGWNGSERGNDRDDGTVVGPWLMLCRLFFILIWMCSVFSWAYRCDAAMYHICRCHTPIFKKYDHTT